MSTTINYVGPPNSGIWEVGQVTVDTAGQTWQCTGRGVAGQPGTTFQLIGEPPTSIIGTYIASGQYAPLPSPRFTTSLRRS